MWIQSNENQTHTRAPTLFTFHSPANISLGYSWLCFGGKGGPRSGRLSKAEKYSFPSPECSSHFLPPLPLFGPQHQEMPLVPWCQIHKTHTHPYIHTLRYSHSLSHRYAQVSSDSDTCTHTHTYTDTHITFFLSHSHLHTQHSVPGMGL